MTRWDPSLRFAMTSSVFPDASGTARNPPADAIQSSVRPSAPGYSMTMTGVLMSHRRMEDMPGM